MDVVSVSFSWVISVDGCRAFFDDGLRRLNAFNDVRRFPPFIRWLRNVPLFQVITNDRGSATADFFPNGDWLNDQDDDRVSVCRIGTRSHGHARGSLFGRQAESAYVAACRSLIYYRLHIFLGRYDVDDRGLGGDRQVRPIFQIPTCYSASAEGEFGRYRLIEFVLWGCASLSRGARISLDFRGRYSSIWARQSI